MLKAIPLLQNAMPLTKNSFTMNASCRAFILINISEQFLADEESKAPIHKNAGNLPQKLVLLSKGGVKSECVFLAGMHIIFI